MKRIGIALALGLLAAASRWTTVQDANPDIHAEDVHRFFEIYDAADGRPSAETLERDYLDRGSEALRTLARIYPEARLPPVTIAVGRGRPVAVGSPVTGIQVGLEALCATDWLNPDLSDWLFNTTAGKPGDLGYRVGYRVVKTYYRRAVDKRRALREILAMSDPKAFLAKSGWYPGIELD